MTSRDILQCFYCAIKDRRDNFKKNRHFEKHHPGCRERYKPIGNNISIFEFAAKKRRLDSEGEGAVGAEVGTIESSSSTANDKRTDFRQPVRVDNAQVVVDEPINAYSEINNDLDERDEASVDPPCRENADQLRIFPVFNVPTSATGLLRAQSATLRAHGELLEDIKTKLEENLKLNNKAKVRLDLKMEISSLGPYELNEVFRLVECKVCCNHKYSLLPRDRPGGLERIGVFKCPDDIDPARRRDLLSALRDHLGTTSHIKCAALADVKRKGREQSIELAVSRCVYFSVVEHLSGRCYERLLALNSVNGTKIGDMGHSRNSFRPLFIKAMVLEMRGRIRALFGRRWSCFGNKPSPMAASCDKVTIRRRTLQPCAGFTLVNGRICCYLLNAPLVKEKSGQALSDLLIKTLEEFFDRAFLKDHLAGVATDGEYHNLRLGQKIRESLGVDTGRLVHAWCLAHRLELACNDASKGVTDIRSELHQHMPARHGKAFEALEQASLESGLPYYVPLAFMPTRWASSESRVYENFCRNYPLLVAMGEPKICRCDWMVKFLLAYDTMKVVANASGSTQQVFARPWQTAAAIQALRDSVIVGVAALEMLVDAIEVAPYLVDVPPHFFEIDMFPSLFEAKFHDHPSWKGVELEPVPESRFTGALHFMIGWLLQLKNSLNVRIISDFPEWLVAASQLFSAEALFGEGQELSANDKKLDTNRYPHLEHMEVTSLIEAAGISIIDQEEYNLDVDELASQYTILLGRIREGVWPKTSCGQMDTAHTWEMIHCSRIYYVGIEDLLYLIAWLSMRTFNESVVEAMCSCLNTTDPRRHVGHELLSDEGLLAWNKLGISSDALDDFLASSLKRMPQSFQGFQRKSSSRAQRRQTKFKVSQVVDRICSVNAHPELSFIKAEESLRISADDEKAVCEMVRGPPSTPDTLSEQCEDSDD